MSFPPNRIDRTERPDWAVGPDGRMVKITADERFPALFEQWQGDACLHEKTTSVRKFDSINREAFYEACTNCGMLKPGAIARASVSEYSVEPERYAEQNERYNARRQTALDRICHAAAERCQSGNRAEYDDYLRSPEWKRRAAKIMDRANGICEGCLTEPATEVHHRTYENLGNEFAFELLALCDRCHRRIHKKSAA